MASQTIGGGAWTMNLQLDVFCNQGTSDVRNLNASMLSYIGCSANSLKELA